MGSQASRGPEGQQSTPQETKKGFKSKLKDINLQCKNFQRICFAVLAVITCLFALGQIATATLAALATELFSSVLVTHVVGLVILAFTGLVVFFASGYAIVLVYRRSNYKCLRITAILLVTIATIQTVLTVVAVRVSRGDEALLLNDMVNEFTLAKNGNLKSIHTMSSLQYELKCCGVFEPTDYEPTDATGTRRKSPPIAIPASCCPQYDVTNPDYPQELIIRRCIQRKTYYPEGCHKYVKNIVRNTAASTIVVTIFLVILEVLEAVLVTKAYRRIKHKVAAESRQKNLEQGSDQTTE